MLTNRLLDIKIKRLSLNPCELELTGSEAACWVVSDKNAVVYITSRERDVVYVVRYLDDKLALFMYNLIGLTSLPVPKWSKKSQSYISELVRTFSVPGDCYYSYLPYYVPYRDLLVSIL